PPGREGGMGGMEEAHVGKGALAVARAESLPEAAAEADGDANGGAHLEAGEGTTFLLQRGNETDRAALCRAGFQHADGQGDDELGGAELDVVAVGGDGAHFYAARLPADLAYHRPQ